MDIHFPLEKKDIETILPHREPFLFVDRVMGIDAAGRIEAEKNILSNEWFLKGHFPEMPMVPGVIISEALAQTSGLLVALNNVLAGCKDENPMFFLAGVNMKYLNPVRPQNTLCLTSGLKREFGGIYMFDVQASVADQPVGRGTLTLASTPNVS